MPRARALLLVLLLGCGGRDPLLGVDDQGVLVPPTMAGSGGSGGGAGAKATGGSGGSVGTPGTGGTPSATPPAPPDAGIPRPPVIVPDAAPPVARDAAPANPPMPGSCAFPGCVAMLQAACMPTGSCVQQRVSGGGGIGQNLCYANGVKLITSISGNGRNQQVTIRVLRPDGTGCYTVEPESRGGGVTGLNYRAPSGQIVASAFVERGRLAITCTGSNVPQVVESSCQPGLQVGNSCTSGTCQ